MATDDTIIAVSTPGGYALRAVVRLSGRDALEIVARRFAAHRETDDGWMRSFRATPGTLSLEGGNLCVPCTVYVMRAPHSYTREDVVELHLPGSPALLDIVLDDLLAAGRGALRLALPGEFTERAFLNGRIDLSQAEAVLSVIRARNEAELAAAVAKLDGAVSNEIACAQRELAELRALIEAALDFAEHGVDPIRCDEFIERADRIRSRLQSEVDKVRDELASDGCLRVVLCGPPNAGKSSLLNRLAGRQVAIVHETPGTTRDPVSAEVEVDGVFFRVSDTAGLRDDAEGVEAVAIERTRRLARAAQLVVLVLDGSRPLPAGALDVARGVQRQKVLCAINKSDLPQELDESEASAAAAEVVHVSALTGEGMDEFRQALGRVVFQGRLDASAADCLFNARQRDAVRRALGHIGRAEEAVRDGMGYEFAALDLREAADALGEVTGQVGAQDVLDIIFSRFCIGK
jgi:tRNA modification GTPase